MSYTLYILMTFLQAPDYLDYKVTHEVSKIPDIYECYFIMNEMISIHVGEYFQLEDAVCVLTYEG